MIVRSLRRFSGPILLLAAIVVGDQIRIHRPDHKFRLIVEVDTPAGLRSASGVYSVHPDRGYVQGNSTTTKGDAIALDVGGGKTLVMMMATENENRFDLDDFSFIAVRAFSAAGQRASFKRMDRMTGAVPVTGGLIPLLATFATTSDPATMSAVKPDAFAASFGSGVSLRGIRVEIVPNGYWPIDVGGALGEGVTRGIAKVLPWAGSRDADAKAIAAAGWTLKPGEDATMAFTR